MTHNGERLILNQMIDRTELKTLSEILERERDALDKKSKLFSAIFYGALH